jgi:hypothetical protein
MHIPLSRTARHFVRRFVTWPLTDAWYSFRSATSAVGNSGQTTGVPRRVFEGAHALSLAEWVILVKECSEQNSPFFSDNLVSNESSYLQVAETLESAPKGLAYIGVGPEQNFSYIAMVEPSFAFIVDCRRDNVTLHLLYKALFEEASSRTEWVSLLFGREYNPKIETEAATSVEALFDRIFCQRSDKSTFAESHTRLRRRLNVLSGLRSLSLDFRALERFHRRFFQQGLEITFELHTPNQQRYPTLRSLFLARTSDGRERSFLATAEAYESVRRLHLENRVIPVVGDFTGYKTFTKISEFLRQRGLSAGVVYASNVEQMVWEQRRWRHWVRNLNALPLAPEALVVRTYIDQGRAHPQQMTGHRTTTLVRPVLELLEQQRRRPYQSHWDLVARKPLFGPG